MKALPTTPARSRLMSRVRQRGTAPELHVRRIARSLRLGLAYNGRALPGRPDLVDRTGQSAVFVHGCFWHRHPGCVASSTPKAHAAFWRAKFEANVARDRRAVKRLRALGFGVMTVWECQLRTPAGRDRVARRLHAFVDRRRNGRLRAAP